MRSVIARNIPPYAIVDSNRIIKYRFDKETIEKLLRFDFSTVEEKDYFENKHFFQSHDFNQTLFESKFYLSHLKK